MVDRSLSPEDYRAALERLQDEHGMSHNKIAEILGAGNGSSYRWAAVGAPRYIAYALAALIAGLPPWPEKVKME